MYMLGDHLKKFPISLLPQENEKQDGGASWDCRICALIVGNGDGDDGDDGVAEEPGSGEGRPDGYWRPTYSIDFLGVGKLHFRIFLFLMIFLLIQPKSQLPSQA